MELGAVLRKMRKGAGMSQETISERLHISRSNISKMENNQIDIRGRDLIKWAQQTNSQDMLVALVCNIDIASAAQMLVDVLPTAGLIFLGGII